MISYFDVFTMNRLEGINKELDELNSSTLRVINFETYDNYTRVWYSREEIKSPDLQYEAAVLNRLKEAKAKLRDK